MRRLPSLLAALALVAGCGDDSSSGGGEGGAGGGPDASTTTSTSTSASSTTATTSATSSGTTTTSSTGGGPACDGTTPTPGDACSSPGQSCEYGAPQLCGDGSTIALAQVYTCEAGTWQLRLETDRDCCPGVPPPSGTTECRHAGQTCWWYGEEACAEGGARQGQIEAECDGETWITTHDLGQEPCDLEPTCPAEPPRLYEACEAEARCLYLRASPCPDGEGYDVVTFASCEGGVWFGANLAEGAACTACAESLPSCNDDLRGVVCPFEHGEVPCVDATGFATGTIGVGRSLQECGEDGWDNIADHVDCAE